MVSMAMALVGATQDGGKWTAAPHAPSMGTVCFAAPTACVLMDLLATLRALAMFKQIVDSGERQRAVSVCMGIGDRAAFCPVQRSVG